ncbi:alkyl hydroperoxide reductase subunit F [Gleimia hominis]|uniref:Alkyl hydroperoxide reductase subunit F n=1 Tax=Gleimia hominis TaxID=595468 RepID=A0ABU3IBK9_9ACTO|nr:alkyl hydroperoxide reductase subunit F [Gleimia hominis]MDT3767769.1 alkyl hydroperoxide reductase subunit F [Gleimia hominis]
MSVLNPQLSAQLEQVLQNLRKPITLVASLDEGDKSAQMRELLQEIADKSELVSIAEEPMRRTPSFVICRNDSDVAVTFAGIPLGHEFTSLVLALLHVGGHPMKLTDQQVEAIQAVKTPREFTTYMSLTCQNCPDVVQALNMISVLNPLISHTTVEGGAFKDEVEQRNIMSVPAVFEGDEMVHSGRATVDDFIALIDTDAQSRATEEMNNAQPYDVLVVGGGPAGASAAIYSARKGLRTAVLAEREGGQVLDTMSIENLVPTIATTGPQLAEDLKGHVRHYDVDVYAPHEAIGLTPAAENGFHKVTTAAGGALEAKNLVVATGASWRLLGVPGESEYRNKGVSFCPHCDGPLFEGKNLAVIGGGNSGVEAAIDLAGVAKHVTVVEFADHLMADEVLQKSARERSNIDFVTSTQTTSIDGDGSKVTGLTYLDRATQEEHRLDVDGVFIQIGLVPSTQWLEGVLELNGRGEIKVDRTGATSVPGIYAAGDCTDTPYKQILTALGAGATAALGAFDYSIRHTAN